MPLSITTPAQGSTSWYSWGQAVTSALVTSFLTPTGIKTANYTAVLGDLVEGDATNAGFTVTAPATGSAGQSFGVKKLENGSNVITITASGTDVFVTGIAGGVYQTSPTVTLTVQETRAWVSNGGNKWLTLDGYISKATTDTIYEPIFGTINDGGNAGTSKTLATPLAATENRYTLNSATCAFTLPTIARGTAEIQLILKQDATGGRNYTITNSGLTWLGGTQPALDQTANAYTWLSFYTPDAGTTWIGSGPSSGSGSGGSLARNPVTVTANYTASLNDIVKANTTGGGFTVTLPPASAKGSVTVSWFSGNIAPTIAAQGTDRLTSATGPTTITPDFGPQYAYTFENDAAGVWSITSSYLPTGQVPALNKIGGAGWLYVGTGNAAVTGLAPGPNGTYLGSNGTNLSWSTPAGGSSSSVRKASWISNDNGLDGVSDPPYAFQNGTQTISSTVTGNSPLVAKVWVAGGAVLNAAWFNCSAQQGVGTGSGYYAALYDFTGVLVTGGGIAMVTPDFSSNLLNIGNFSAAFNGTYTTSADGFLYVSFKPGSFTTTQPKMAAGAGIQLSNIGLTVGTGVSPGAGAPKYALGSNTWTGATPPQTLGTLSSTGAVVYFVGVS